MVLSRWDLGLKKPISLLLTCFKTGSKESTSFFWWPQMAYLLHFTSLKCNSFQSVIKIFVIQPWWLSGLELVSNSSRHSSKPRFNPRLGHIYWQIYMVAFRTHYSPQTNLDTTPKSEPTLELISRDAPSMEAHHCSVGPDAGINSGGRRIIRKKIYFCTVLKKQK